VWAVGPAAGAQTKTQPSGNLADTYDVLGDLRTVVLDTGVRIDYLVDALNRRIGKEGDHGPGL
jgi:hypothetical protein